MLRDPKKKRRRARPGSLRRRLQDWAETNPWTWLSVTVVITWFSIFLAWTLVFYLGFAAAYATFSTGIDPERVRLVLISGFFVSSVVAPLLGATWGIKLKRELEAMKELEEYVSEVNDKEKQERAAIEKRETARAERTATNGSSVAAEGSNRSDS
ncbi:MAG TPA: hypothetical protein VI893_02250 [Thermoplasmata archaeon]|nr:hypothetical protein [Thermoplasmata archaeon]